MTFDWFTFTAQIVNFLVLVALLKRFLYGPVVNAIQQREDEIASSRDEVAYHRRLAEEQSRDYRLKLEAWERQREQLLEETEQEVEELRKQMLVKARDTVERRREDWLQAVEREKSALAHQIRHRACREVMLTTRRTLKELADTDLEKLIILRFLEHLDEMGEDECRRIQAAVSRDADTITIRTSFDVEPSVRDQIRSAVVQRFDIDCDISFHSSSDVVCGIELLVGGTKLAWSVDEFLSSVEEEIEREVI